MIYQHLPLQGKEFLGRRETKIIVSSGWDEAIYPASWSPSLMKDVSEAENVWEEISEKMKVQIQATNRMMLKYKIDASHMNL